MMSENETQPHDGKNLRKAIASAIILALSAFLIYAFIPYVNAFFGAIILYTLFHPLYLRLKNGWRLNAELSAVVVIVFSIFLITIPSIYVMTLLINEVNVVVSNVDVLSRGLDEVDRIIPGIDVRGLVNDQVTNMGALIRDQLVSMLLKFTNTLANLTIMYFILYYMLVNHQNLPKIAMAVSPFNEKNTRRLAQELSSVTHCTIVSQGMVGVLHGIMLGAGFYCFGIPEPVFWGFIGAIFSMLPVLGTPLIWVPAGIYKIVMGELIPGYGILVWGAILTNVDSLMRPFIQLKVSKMHPLVSIIGFFIGITYFGILGIIVGPLLLSYFFLMFGMFKEEYLTHGERTEAHDGTHRD
jgi:predicted PurR-regulated permease PerM